MKKNGFSPILILILVFAIGAVAFFFFKNDISKLSVKAPTASTSPLANDSNNPVSQTDLQKIANSHSSFGFSLLNKLISGDQTENIVISPTSLSLALSMVYEGANGQTRTNMAKVLNLQNLSDSDVNNFLLNLDDYLTSDSNTTVRIANSLWQSVSTPLITNYVSLISKYYKADNFNVDFTNGAKVADQANSWVNDKTNGKITSIVNPDSFNKYTLALIINAVYFKGRWTNEFDKSSTQTDTFYSADGTKEQVNMMAQDYFFDYYETNSFQAVRLPYGEGDYRMDIFLPKTSLADFAKSLSAANWKAWLKNLEPTNQLNQVNLKLPSFKLDYEAGENLKTALTTMGMGDSFTKDADFSRMVQKSSTPYYIDKIIHKATITVDEEGSEAAAATAILPASGGGSPPDHIYTMTVNKPFLFVIENRSTGEILFLGYIQKI